MCSCDIAGIVIWKFLNEEKGKEKMRSVGKKQSRNPLKKNIKRRTAHHVISQSIKKF
jgi:hypothetical protein